MVKTFEKFKVLTERELHARYEVNVETYNKTINVEAQLMVLMANRYILPAALEYQRAVAASVTAVKQAGGVSREGKKLLDQDRQAGRSVPRADRRARRAARARGAVGREAREVHARQGGAGDGRLRDLGDQLELMVPHATWPLPTYREMLFIK